MNFRIIEEKFFEILMIVSSVIICGVLVLILGTIIVKGLPSINLEMITQVPKGGYYLGSEKRVLNAILGSLYLGIGAVILSVAVSLPVVLYINIYAKKNSFILNFTRFCFDVLWGVPAIVYGAFGFALMLFLGMRPSLLAGIIIIAIVILPILSRSIDEVIKNVPPELSIASYTLGANKLETAVKVILKQSLPGICTAVIIAFGRGIGNAAAVLFTAGFTDNIPQSLTSPAATLPLAIFFQYHSPLEQVKERAYAAAFILTAMILIINILVRLINKIFSKNILK